ncbi:MAG: hypothetical protein CMN78_05465 [Spirochaetales bacterium]|nr:hypothetical protein [Spirochaetales bacterium]
MVKVAVFPALFILIAIVACATVESGESEVTVSATEVKEPPQEEGADAASASEVSEPAIVRTFRIAKTRLFLANGVFDSFIVIKYQEGLLMAENEFYADGTPSGAVVYIYDGSNIVETQKRAADGSYLSGHAFKYGEAGSLERDILLDSQKEPILTSTYEYDVEGRKIRWAISDRNSVVLGYAEYLYDSGRNVRVENYSASGVLQEFMDRTFDPQGYPTKELITASDGKEIERVELDYDGGHLSTKTLYLQTRKIGSTEYRYDDDDNLIKEIRYGRTGDAVESFEYEYEEVQ